MKEKASCGIFSLVPPGITCLKLAPIPLRNNLSPFPPAESCPHVRHRQVQFVADHCYHAGVICGGSKEGPASLLAPLAGPGPRQNVEVVNVFPPFPSQPLLMFQTPCAPRLSPPLFFPPKKLVPESYAKE